MKNQGNDMIFISYNHNDKQFIDMYSDKYDRIVLSSDVDGRIAKYCDGTVIMYEESEFGELSAENYVDELENNKCNVLGVVING